MPTAKIDVSVVVIVAVVVPVVWSAMEPSVVSAAMIVPVVVLYAMVVVGCVPTMALAMAVVGGLLEKMVLSVIAVAMAFVFRFDFLIFYTVEAPVVIVGCCCLLLLCFLCVRF